MGIRGLSYSPKKPTHVLYVDGKPAQIPFDFVASRGSEGETHLLQVIDQETKQEVGNDIQLTVFEQGRGGIVGSHYLAPHRDQRRINRKGVEFEGW